MNFCLLSLDKISLEVGSTLKGKNLLPTEKGCKKLELIPLKTHPFALILFVKYLGSD